MCVRVCVRACVCVCVGGGGSGGDVARLLATVSELSAKCGVPAADVVAGFKDGRGRGAAHFAANAAGGAGVLAALLDVHPP